MRSISWLVMLLGVALFAFGCQSESSTPSEAPPEAQNAPVVEDTGEMPDQAGEAPAGEEAGGAPAEEPAEGSAKKADEGAAPEAKAKE